MKFDGRSLSLVACATGVVGSLLLYGLLQEKIMQRPYDGLHFRHTLFLVLINRVVTAFASAILCIVNKVSMRPPVSVAAFASISLSNVVATTSQYEALKYISFAFATLAKSAKMVPVMIWGTIMPPRKQYAPKDYLVAVAVAIGCTLFVLAGDIPRTSKSHDSPSSLLAGVLLMCTYLAFDGYTSVKQSQIFTQTDMSVTVCTFWVNVLSASLSLFGLLLGGAFLPAVGFAAAHPQLLNDALVLSIASMSAQLIITKTIKVHGALVFATIMVTRQLLSVLASCVVYKHTLTPVQLGGAILVFAALYLRGR